jgi:mannosyltransferase
VLGAGLASYWRQSPPLTGLFVLPVLLTALMLLAMRHNLWPRFFFFSAGFAVLLAIRGGFVLCGLAFRERGPRVATGGAILAIVASALTVPRAWGPKQDFLGAERFVDRTRSTDDAVVTVDLTVYPYLRWLRRDWEIAESLGALEAIERLHPRTWVLYTFPIRLAAVQPGIWERLAARYDTAAVFRGTIGGGAVVVMRSRTTPPGR